MTSPIFDISGSSISYYKNWKSISDDPENFALCVARERWQEIEYSMDAGRSIFWDGDHFHDSDNNNVILSPHLKYYLRTPAPVKGNTSFWDMLSCTNNNFTSRVEFGAQQFWPLYIPEKFLKRKVGIVPVRMATDKFLRSIGDKFFIKTVHKDWSFAGTVHEWYDTCACYSTEALSNSAYLIYSDYMDIERDDIGELEYRCFFIEGRMSISRHLDYKNPPIPNAVRDFALDIENELIGKYLPRNSVVDVCLSGGDPRIVEVNGPCSSGRYINNSVESLFG